MNDLSKIFKDGILVDVNVSFWSGAKKLDEEDLGLKDVPEAYTLGKKHLIPRKVIQSFRRIENQARRKVEQNSFPFPIGNARFIPRKKFVRVLNDLKVYQEEYNALVEDLIVKFNEYRVEMQPEFVDAAEKAYINSQPDFQTFGPERDIEAEKKAFKDAFLARINALYPPVSTLRSRFSLNWSVYELAMPRLKEGDTEQIAEDQQVREALEVEYRQQMHAKINNFVADVVGILREETAEVCSHIVESITQGKVVRATTIESLRTFINKFQEMNFVGDKGIEEQLNAVRQELLSSHSNADFIEDKALQATLKERLGAIVEQVKSTTDVNSITGEYRRKIEWE